MGEQGSQQTRQQRSCTGKEERQQRTVLVNRCSFGSGSAIMLHVVYRWLLSHVPSPLTGPSLTHTRPHVRMSSPHNNSDAIAISRSFIQPLSPAVSSRDILPTIRILSGHDSRHLLLIITRLSLLSGVRVVGYGGGNRRVFFVSAPGFSQIASPSCLMQKTVPREEREGNERHAGFCTHLLIANDYLSKSRYNWNSCKSTHKQKVAHKQPLTD